jgi:hypothetical protein
MLYARLGNTGLLISKLAFAAANLRLAVDEVAKLEEMTRPTPNYPNWFNANIDTDAKKALEG